jgi:DNA-binding NtrC family response regulator
MLREHAHIGLVEDDPVMGGSLVQRLELEGWHVDWWRCGRDAVAEIPVLADSLDLVICDICLPDISGEEVFGMLATMPAAPPFIFVTGYGEIDQAVRLMRSGAADFITKPFSMDDFLKRIEASRRTRFVGSAYALGESPAMHRVEDLLSRYAGHDLPVLISGETGAGKEVAARFLHQTSGRDAEPFVAVNCAAIPAELLESEIFGHEKGAFTGAYQRHLGYAERAGKGTLFLDEIGDMPLPLQAKLLRLIEEGSFHRVGGECAVPFRARIVAASNRDLAGATASREFREDLYFRLAVLPIDIPPLRERPEDIICLLERFRTDAAARTLARIRGYSALAKEAALAHPWPGNVRELRNRVERAVALAANEWIMPGDLFPEQVRRVREDTFAPLAEVRNEAERRQIERALERSGGQVGKAASLLAISRTTLWEKMTRFGLAERARSES